MNRLELDLPFRTIVRVLLTAIVVVAAIHLWSMMVLTFMAILIAVTLQPFRARLARRLPQGVATAIVAASLVAGVALFFGLLLPSLVSQISGVVTDWPKLRDQINQSLPDDRMVRPLVHQLLSHPGITIGDAPKHLVEFGGMALGGVTEFVLLLTLAMYFLVDGKRAYDWILAFFDVDTRAKLHRTAADVSDVIAAYVSGQFITSALVAGFAFTLLLILKVPGALMLAFLAGLFDVLPIVGFFISAVPAILLAMTVSTGTALAVFGAYLAYHAIENYFIVPKIYGNKLRLSALAVLLSLLVGGTLAGVAGAVLILPIVASYPIIERIWLKEFLGARVIQKHDSEPSA